MRPLDPLRSIKTKLGVIIVGSLGTALVLVWIGLSAGLRFAWIALVAGALAIAMVQLLAHGMTSPLRQMAKAVEALSKGDYSRRVTATSRDEVGQLARAFNLMAGELEEVDRMRKDLVANVSHELRTPISGLKAKLENMIDGIESDDPQALRTMLSQIDRLGRLVERLLDLSRLESGASPLETRVFDLSVSIAQAVQEAQFHQTGVKVLCVVPPGLKAFGDPERIHQVIANLLENAIRYSPAGGSVEVNAEESPNYVLIEVSDEGQGVPVGDESRVFERFYRSDASRSSNEGGIGLGLAIAKWIIDLHGGQIKAERNVPTGCKMVVTIPGANG